MNKAGSIRRTRRLFAPVCVFAALVILVGACSSDDNTNASGGSSSSSSTEAASGTPLKFGALIDASGPLSGDQGFAVDILEAWVDDTNANGGVAGHPVELAIKDSKGDAPTATTAAQELIDDESVVAMLLLDYSSEAAVGQTLSDGGLPVVGGGGFFPPVWGAGANPLFEADQLPGFFGITTGFPAVIDEMVIAAKSHDLKTIAAVACAERPVCAQATPVLEAAAKGLGLAFTGSVTIAADAPDYTAECLQFIKDGVDFIQMGVSSAVGIRVASDCKAQGYDGYFGASAGSVSPDLYNNLGDNKLTGGLHGFPWYVDAPPVQRYRDVMDAAGVEVDKYGTPTSTGIWATMELFKRTLDANAANLSPAVTRQEVLDAYFTISGETLDGLLPAPVTYTKGSQIPTPQCFWVYTSLQGDFTGDFEPTCPPAG